MKETFLNIPEEKRAVVIDKAFDEFIEFGYENASTNRLVKAIGISKGSLFKYFESKEDIFNHLLIISLSELRTHMSRYVYGGQGIISELLGYAEWEYDFLIKYPKYYHFFYMIQKEMGKEWFKPYEQILLEDATVMAQKLFSGLNLSPRLADHVSLVLNAYNQRFMSGLKLSDDFSSMRHHYFEGLKNHLNLIDWRENET